jgi:hypothetical protein
MAKSRLRRAAKRAYLELLRLLPDRLAVDLDYFHAFGALPNLANPRRFSEKMQCPKLRDRDKRIAMLVDKVRVKGFVSTALGEQWLVPDAFRFRDTSR